MSRYLVGIDLGTTHTVVAYADSQADDGSPQVFAIDQLVAPGEVARRPLLASMRYHPTTGEISDHDRLLPWQPDVPDPVPDAVLGALAQELGSKVPGRLVTSAKSWLSHPGVDRSAPILPWGVADEVARISPLDASASYLRHVRHAWDRHFPDTPLADQELVLTVPASFDEAARQLTVEAARLSGLPQVRLLEEPQAACYDWLVRHTDDLENALSDIRTLLVCDVGGGTTDLTLIRIDREQGTPQLVRIGVGNHLMLGGDNMDLALAHVAERRLLAAGGQLSAAQLSQLVQQCRRAKERLLAPDAPDKATVTLLGAGARLVGQARSTELTREEVVRMVVDGFFPETGSDERPHQRRAGLVEFGLPYAADPAVTRHLAAFLADHRQALGVTQEAAASDQAVIVPDAVLLNGGVFHGSVLSQRLLQVLGGWRGDAPKLLHNDNPDLAVARGAVAYALARNGRGARIGGGAARSLLLLVDGAGERDRRAVCLLPRGAEEGREQRLNDRVFALRLGQPVSFNLVTSSRDRPCVPGELVAVDNDHFQALPPLATVLDAAAGSASTSREVPVELAAMLTDVGTLQIECVAIADDATDLQQRWRMEFQLRGQGTQAAVAIPAKLPANFAQAVQRLERVYGARDAGAGPKETKGLLRDLEQLLGRRNDWETGLLRELFDVLWDGARRRRRTADHERLWFNLAGYCLRPGYGHPLDDWRVHRLWNLYEQGVQYKTEARTQAEWWTLWRRVAGGLDQARQLRILKDVEGRIANPGQRGAKGVNTTALGDMIRLVGNLERLPMERKTRLGNSLLRAGRKPSDVLQRWWALGRLGARVPLHGNVHDVVPPEVAVVWLKQLLQLDWQAIEPAAFAVVQIARRCGDRARDLAPDVRDRVVARLSKEKAPQKWISMVEEIAELDSADELLAFGESLPPGLRLVD